MLRISHIGLETDVAPQAIFWRPLIYFTTEIRESEDNLDHYKAVTFSIDNKLSFDLRNYRGHPENTVTVYFSLEMQAVDQIVAAVATVAEETSLPKYAVAWRRGWEFEYGALRRQDADRLREPEARILALKIAGLSPKYSASTEHIKREVPRYYPLSDADRQPSPSRKSEARWQQIVGNVISHQKSFSSLFSNGLAIRTFDGISVTPQGLDYLKSIGFIVSE